MIAIHPQKIEGNWRKGAALDIHTTSSTYLGVDAFGHDKFDNAYSEIGGLLNRLKYHSDLTGVPEIVEAAAEFLRSGHTKFDLIIPVPPSTVRAVQPVFVLADEIGAATGLPVIHCVNTTRSTTQLKNVTDPDKRKEMLEGLYVADASYTSGKNILLFDDLFRSGSTMNAITDELLRHGRATDVCVLTITRTRSNR